MRNIKTMMIRRNTKSTVMKRMQDHGNGEKKKTTMIKRTKDHIDQEEH
jgi:hypothetical protein